MPAWAPPLASAPFPFILSDQVTGRHLGIRVQAQREGPVSLTLS